MAKVSIIIPAYQSEHCIGKTMEILIQNYTKDIENKEKEIIVVNDGSNDRTQEILEKYQKFITIIKNEKNMGRGFSVRRAYLSTNSEYALFTDADLPYGIDSINRLIGKLKQGSLAVVGQRDNIEHNLLRKITHWGFLMCTKIILGVNFKDTQCGLKGFKTEIIQKISKIAISNRFAFEVETMYLLQKMNIPIDILKVPPADYSHSTIKLKDIVSMFVDLLKIKYHKYNISKLS